MMLLTNQNLFVAAKADSTLHVQSYTNHSHVWSWWNVCGGGQESSQLPHPAQPNTHAKNTQGTLWFAQYTGNKYWIRVTNRMSGSELSPLLLMLRKQSKALGGQPLLHPKCLLPGRMFLPSSFSSLALFHLMWNKCQNNPDTEIS